MKFRYDINILRAIAVVLVVFYHYNVPYFSGGFAGVDIFFVISGYLMSKIILTKMSVGHFSFVDFYVKRAKRIVPALVAVVLFVVVLGNVFFFPEIESKVAQYGIWSLLFVSNIAYYFNSGYFDLSSKTNPLLHTWSLSVEWQFYLMYPVFLWFFRNLYQRKRMLFQGLILCFIMTGFFTMLYCNDFDRSLSFYSLTSRYWEMLVGSLIFLNETYVERNISKKVRLVLSFLSFISIFYFTSQFDDDVTWPGLYTLIPVVCTSLIILSKVDAAVYRLKVFQFIGKISYSLYLWHWPYFVLFLSLGMDSLKYVPLLLVLSFVSACISYRYIEQSEYKRNSYILYLPLFGLMLSGLFYKYPMNKLIYDEQILRLAGFRKDYSQLQQKQFKQGSCFIYSDSRFEDYNKNVCLEIDNHRKNVLLLGDSHAAHFSYSLNKFYAEKNINLLQATTSYCFPLLNPKGRDENVKLINFMYNDFIPKNHSEIDLVIISANWKDKQLYTLPELKTKLLELIRYLESKNIKYIFFGQTETYKYPFPEIIAKKEMFPIIDEDNFIDKRSLESRNFLMKTLPPDRYIDLYNVQSLKHLSKNRLTPYMFDDNHLSMFGTDQIVRYINLKHNIL